MDCLLVWSTKVANLTEMVAICREHFALKGWCLRNHGSKMLGWIAMSLFWYGNKILEWIAISGALLLLATIKGKKRGERLGRQSWDIRNSERWSSKGPKQLKETNLFIEGRHWRACSSGEWTTKRLSSCETWCRLSAYRTLNKVLSCESMGHKKDLLEFAACNGHMSSWQKDCSIFWPHQATCFHSIFEFHFLQHHVLLLAMDRGMQLPSFLMRSLSKPFTIPAFLIHARLRFPSLK